MKKTMMITAMQIKGRNYKGAGLILPLGYSSKYNTTILEYTTTDASFYEAVDGTPPGILEDVRVFTDKNEIMEFDIGLKESQAFFKLGKKTYKFIFEIQFSPESLIKNDDYWQGKALKYHDKLLNIDVYVPADDKDGFDSLVLLITDLVCEIKEELRGEAK